MYVQDTIRKTRCLTLDYGQLTKELDDGTKNIFVPALLTEPELCIGSVGVAVYQVPAACTCSPGPPC
jgi:hypothetical protein